VARPEVVDQASAGEGHAMLFDCDGRTLSLGSVLTLFGFDTTANSNRAPTWMFVALGLAMVVVFVVLLLMVPISGEDFTYTARSIMAAPSAGSVAMEVLEGSVSSKEEHGGRKTAR
jgi:hypothetical protein